MNLVHTYRNLETNNKYNNKNDNSGTIANNSNNNPNNYNGSCRYSDLCTRINQLIELWSAKNNSMYYKGCTTKTKENVTTQVYLRSNQIYLRNYV